MALLPDVGSDHSSISIKIEIRPEIIAIVYAKKWKFNDRFNYNYFIRKWRDMEDKFILQIMFIPS